MMWFHLPSLDFIAHGQTQERYLYVRCINIMILNLRKLRAVKVVIKI